MAVILSERGPERLSVWHGESKNLQLFIGELRFTTLGGIALNIFRRGKLYNDLSEEVRLHLEERAEQLMRDGLSHEEAERQARHGRRGKHSQSNPAQPYRATPPGGTWPSM